MGLVPATGSKWRLDGERERDQGLLCAHYCYIVFFVCVCVLLLGRVAPQPHARIRARVLGHRYACVTICAPLFAFHYTVTTHTHKMKRIYFHLSENIKVN